MFKQQLYEINWEEIEDSKIIKDSIGRRKCNKKISPEKSEQKIKLSQAQRLLQNILTHFSHK